MASQTKEEIRTDILVTPSRPATTPHIKVFSPRRPEDKYFILLQNPAAEPARPAAEPAGTATEPAGAAAGGNKTGTAGRAGAFAWPG
jgi:hypothetical protein